MQDPGQIVEETYTMEEDPEGAMSVVSVETSDDGTTRRTETTVQAWGEHGGTGLWPGTMCLGCYSSDVC